MNRLSGQTAIVTGAGAGIGRATATLFAEEGAATVVSDISAENAQKVAADLTARGFKAHAVTADVARLEDVRELIRQTVQHYGSLHILVNNAAVWQNDATITQLSEETWDRIVDGTLKSVFMCSKYAIPEMIRCGGGSIVNISSVNAVVGIAMTAYTAAKSGVVGLTRLVASEYGPQGIRANAILPGTIGTESTIEAWKSKAKDFEDFKREYPIGRIGTPLELAHCALYLASKEAGFTTGATFVVDGGLSAGRRIRF